MGREKPNKPRCRLVHVELQEATKEQMERTLENYRSLYWECIKNMGIPHSRDLAEAFSFGISTGSRFPFLIEDNEDSFVNAMVLISGFVSRIPD